MIPEELAKDLETPDQNRTNANTSKNSELGKAPARPQKFALLQFRRPKSQLKLSQIQKKLSNPANLLNLINQNQISREHGTDLKNPVSLPKIESAEKSSEPPLKRRRSMEARPSFMVEQEKQREFMNKILNYKKEVGTFLKNRG